MVAAMFQGPMNAYSYPVAVGNALSTLGTYSHERCDYLAVLPNLKQKAVPYIHVPCCVGGNDIRLLWITALEER